MKKHHKDKRHQSQAEIVMERARGMLLIGQQRKQNNFYSGHRILSTPITTRQLCVLFMIVSLLA
jgi:hypothetical protein